MLGAAAAGDEAVARFHAGGGRVDVGTFQTVTNVLLPPVVAAVLARSNRTATSVWSRTSPRPRTCPAWT